LNLTLHVVLEQTKTELNVDATAVLLFNPHAQVLEFAAGIGFRSKAIGRSRLRLGEGLGGHTALEGRTTSITNLLDAKHSAQFTRAPLLTDEGFVTYFSAPLIVKGQVRGILEVFHRSPFIPDQNWLDFLEVLAGQTAIAVDSASLFTNLQLSNTELFNAYDSTIEGWSHALDLRDKETEGHTQRVTEMTMTLARAMGITEEELVHVRRGALLHDIGKMGVPDHILLKPDKLTDEEWVAMRKHPIFAFELLSPIAYLRPALDIPYCHHEKWDGSGYPRGLKGEQIPLTARLFAIIDVWDALLSDRPYRQGWSKEKVTKHIKSLSGTHFDPQVVDVFMQMFKVEEMHPPTVI
jgi:putative nucleotidyltransferase with HDIG domain